MLLAVEKIVSACWHAGCSLTNSLPPMSDNMCVPFPSLLQKIDFIEAASQGSLQGVSDALKAGVHVDATVITGLFDDKVCYCNN